MVFSTSSRDIRVAHDPKDDRTYLCADCKTNSGDWNSSSICLDEHFGISQEYKGFDSTAEQTAVAQGKSLQVLLVPGSLKLKGVSVLCGKVRDEFGGWETSIFLDLFFKNDNGKLVKDGWSTSLTESAAVLKESDDGLGVITGLLLAPDGRMALSQLSLTRDCIFDFNPAAYGGSGIRDRYGSVQACPDNSGPHWEVRGIGLNYRELGGEMRYKSEDPWKEFDISFAKQLSNVKGRISCQEPDASVDEDYRDSLHSELKRGLVEVAAVVGGLEISPDNATKPPAQCAYLSAILSGYLIGELIGGKAAASYAPALAFMTGSAVNSASGPFVADPNMRDEVLAVAVTRVLRAELPAAGEVSLQELFGAITGSTNFDDDERCFAELKSSIAEDLARRGLDTSIADVVTPKWVTKFLETVMEALLVGLSEDDIKHKFEDHGHDGVDLLPPPPTPPESSPPVSPPPPAKKKEGEDGSDYISRWRQDIIAVQDQLYLLEPQVGTAAEQSTAQALTAISNGLSGLNDLLEFWPDYKGDDATNAQRLAIIQSATELVGNGVKTVKDTEGDNSILDQVVGIEDKLNGLKTQFTEETAAEQAELDEIKPKLQTAVEKMFADLKVYQSAQNQVLAKLKEVNEQEHKHGAEPTIPGGIRWYKDYLRRRTSALEPEQSAADTAAVTYIESEQIVVHIQARQAVINDIHKRRFWVQREISKAEMIIRVLKLMIEGTKREEDRILSVVDLILTTLGDLTHIGEPPYHRNNRKVEDQLCTAVLMLHRESLIDSSFVESAKKAVTEVQDWFDDDMPKSTQQEIDAIKKNPLYQA